MKMTSQFVTLVIAVIVCSFAVVNAQNNTDSSNATDGPSPVTQPPSTPRPPVSSAPPPNEGTTAAAGTVTYAPVDGDDGNDTDGDGDGDGMEGDGDMDGHKGKDDDDKDGGGLNDGQIALAILATLLILGALGTFFGLCYWKYRGTSYVTVTSETTYKQ
ncbi:lateral signaling target protein 2 homolog [Lytechinus variegatus]|uniref:lateral signaling target protein 2 homolog n=1 Tax=Lytechinus variegatus TaxID=7654 RepID=UPI001BB1C408|nr:lateral signaling target protein 2 homolog [Lytechinus variegatus]